ncbi:hypothetical protein F3Y22_tig00109926pilonHSYRG00102 [Hibiscus syriacus]|uniref:Uncharacterized protein n=1 Tax=Hibiscus syriacus TaxID=106335 RepID=A0A6A3BS95_HIBSY|nr:hypothetical protein F3Y22_tig00109926pilonHSYRG00102 [Hibiscus syriacus]
MGKKINPLFIFLLVAIFPFIVAEPVRDKQALLDFSLKLSSHLNLSTLSVLLACKTGEGRRPMDWETRLRIAIDINLAAVMSPVPPSAM